MLAGMSVTWYARLESGERIRMSPQTLERLASVLGLDAQERSELFALAIPEVGNAVDDILREHGNSLELERLAGKLYTASTIADAIHLGLGSLLRLFPTDRFMHASELTADGVMYFTDAVGPTAESVIRLGSINLGAFDAVSHIVEDARTTGEMGAIFYHPLHLGSSFCVRLSEEDGASRWIGQTRGEPYAWSTYEARWMLAVSSLVRLALRPLRSIA
jgi:hypothetical protein